MRLVVTVICFIMLSVRTAFADEPRQPDLASFHSKLKALVVGHYPKAEVTLKDRVIRFELHTRKFMIHEPLPNGEWQDAVETVGPRKHGVFATLELRPGKYSGMADLPYSADKLYFTMRVMAPYSAKLDHHLHVQLKCPRNVPAGFQNEFEKLVGDFDKHVAIPSK